MGHHHIQKRTIEIKQERNNGNRQHLYNLSTGGSHLFFFFSFLFVSCESSSPSSVDGVERCRAQGNCWCGRRNKRNLTSVFVCGGKDGPSYPFYLDPSTKGIFECDFLGKGGHYCTVSGSVFPSVCSRWSKGYVCAPGAPGMYHANNRGGDFSTGSKKTHRHGNNTRTPHTDPRLAIPKQENVKKRFLSFRSKLQFSASQGAAAIQLLPDLAFGACRSYDTIFGCHPRYLKWQITVFATFIHSN